MEDAERTSPTHDAPDYGTINLREDESIVLSEVEHWVEDGSHYFRSLDYGIVADGATVSEAVNAFVEWTEDFLSSIADDPDPTPHDLETYRTLSERFRRAYLRLEERERHRRWIEIHVGRRRREARGNWSRVSASRPQKSAPLSTA